MFGDVGPLEAVVLLVGGLLVYFLPSFIAFRQRIDTRRAVLVINVLFGATLVGWLVALCLATRKRQPQPRQTAA
ncbi:superinfection immunity protein [Streptomyces sp. NPDC001793]|uniref:superinfection immunity protein n=1 Tax=Streptomyces sp. NPDC001793 TaxID=3154657 RepID=UPI00331ABBA6